MERRGSPTAIAAVTAATRYTSGSVCAASPRTSCASTFRAAKSGAEVAPAPLRTPIPRANRASDFQRVAASWTLYARSLDAFVSPIAPFSSRRGSGIRASFSSLILSRYFRSPLQSWRGGHLCVRSRTDASTTAFLNSLANNSQSITDTRYAPSDVTLRLRLPYSFRF